MAKISQKTATIAGPPFVLRPYFGGRSPRRIFRGAALSRWASSPRRRRRRGLAFARGYADVRVEVIARFGMSREEAVGRLILHGGIKSPIALRLFDGRPGRGWPACDRKETNRAIPEVIEVALARCASIRLVVLDGGADMEYCGPSFRLFLCRVHDA